MTVIELINQLKDMPHNAQIKVASGEVLGTYRAPRPEMEYNDIAENYLVVL